MSRNAIRVRLALAWLMIGLGIVIVARGVIEVAPLQFTALGGLLVALGLVRLRDWWLAAERSGGRRR